MNAAHAGRTRADLQALLDRAAAQAALSGSDGSEHAMTLAAERHLRAAGADVVAIALTRDSNTRAIKAEATFLVPAFQGSRSPEKDLFATSTVVIVQQPNATAPVVTCCGSLKPVIGMAAIASTLHGDVRLP
jgi:hypothetical protein